MSYTLHYTGYRGPADEDAAIAAAEALIKKYRLTRDDLLAEDPSPAARQVFAAAERAAWHLADGERFSDRSYIGYLEVRSA